MQWQTVAIGKPLPLAKHCNAKTLTAGTNRAIIRITHGWNPPLSVMRTAYTAFWIPSHNTAMKHEKRRHYEKTDQQKDNCLVP